MNIEIFKKLNGRTIHVRSITLSEVMEFRPVRALARTRRVTSNGPEAYGSKIGMRSSSRFIMRMLDRIDRVRFA